MSERHGVRGAKGTAIAVAALAALTASQAPGATPAARAAAPAHPEPGTGRGPSVSGDAPYRTELPPLRARRATTPEVDGALPVSVFAAYRRAEARLAHMSPGCGLQWQLLAAIGQVESGQARGGRVTEDGTTRAPILGPRLDGNGFALIRDTDGGALDRDTAYDRAVGPMQFIPSTWAVWGTDGTGDGRADPHNVFDAALAAGRYLCAGGRNLTTPGDLDAAILGYNHSTAYLRTVRAWFAYFLAGHRVVPDAGTPGGRGAERATAPPVPREPSPAPGTRRPGNGSGTPSPGPAPSPAGPRPSPTGHPSTRPSPRPPLPLPGSGAVLPGGDLPGGDLLPAADAMGAAPSPSVATGR
ncbi:lytic transglycosylase domain-containing protein [Streptomyces sp. NPDC052023]|uniref:lytic transglycosylase domain-containing protein n=1 Tax=Streptomyces sp. NPDC052023 TaxID=3365681 RepID=UPI0037D7A1A4